MRSPVETEATPDELSKARETIRRLNRRCQSAERGLAEKLDETQRAGWSLGRGLANSAASMYRAQIEAVDQILDAANVPAIASEGTEILSLADRVNWLGDTLKAESESEARSLREALALATAGRVEAEAAHRIDLRAIRNTLRGGAVLVQDDWKPSVIDVLREIDELRGQLSAAESSARSLREQREALQAKYEGRKFPIMDGPAIPWIAIAPFEHQAKENHGGQTLERLAERGGLGVQEALHVMLCARWRSPEGKALETLPQRDAILKLNALAAASVSPSPASTTET